MLARDPMIGTLLFKIKATQILRSNVTLQQRLNTNRCITPQVVLLAHNSLYKGRSDKANRTLAKRPNNDLIKIAYKIIKKHTRTNNKTNTNQPILNTKYKANKFAPSSEQTKTPTQIHHQHHQQHPTQKKTH